MITYTNENNKSQESDIGEYNKCWEKAGKGIHKCNKNTENYYTKNKENNKLREQH